MLLHFCRKFSFSFDNFFFVQSNTIPPFTKMSLYSLGARITFQKNSYGSRPECPLRFLFSFVWQSLYIFVWEVPPYTPFLLTVGRFSGVSISPPIGQMEALPHPTLASRRSRKKQKFLASCLFAKKFLHKQAWCSMFITIHFMTFVSFLCSWSDLIPIQIVLCKTTLQRKARFAKGWQKSCASKDIAFLHRFWPLWLSNPQLEKNHYMYM